MSRGPVLSSASSRRTLLRLGVGGLTAALFGDLGLARATAAQEQKKYTFANFSAPNGVTASLYGINDAGQAVGFYTDSSQVGYAVLVPAGANSFRDLAAPENRLAAPLPAPENAFVAPNGPPATTAPGEAIAMVVGITDAGQVVGSYDVVVVEGVAVAGRGFVQSADGKSATVIDAPEGVGGTFAFGINNAGQVVGSYIDASGTTGGFIATPES